MSEAKDITDGFFDRVTYHGRPWTLHIKHYLALSSEERERYNVCDGEFLVHMYCTQESMMFKVFLDNEEPLFWCTDANLLLVDSELVDVIGNRIELAHNHFEEDSKGDYEED